MEKKIVEDFIYLFAACVGVQHSDASVGRLGRVGVQEVLLVNVNRRWYRNVFIHTGTECQAINHGT